MNDSRKQDGVKCPQPSEEELATAVRRQNEAQWQALQRAGRARAREENRR